VSKSYPTLGAFVARQINRLVARTLSGLNKPGRHNDGGGLYLNVSKQGAKSWVVLYKQGKWRGERNHGPRKPGVFSSFP